MKMKLILICALFFHCICANFYGAGNSQVEYEGRYVILSNNSVEFDWSCVTANIKFEGTQLYVHMSDSVNQFNVFLEGKLLFVLNTTSEKKVYPLATGLSHGTHSMALTRRTEAHFGVTIIDGFSTDGNLLPPNPSKKKERRIEFCGDGIT